MNHERQDESPAPKAGGRRNRWKRTLLLVTLFVCLFFVAVAERGGPAISKVRKDGIVATLLDPMSLFAGRSPGERGEGALLPTKLAKAGPEERVLSQVRDREPGLGNPPPPSIPGMLPDAALPGAPGENVLPGGLAGGEPCVPFGAPFAAPGGPGGPGGPGVPPTGPVSGVPEPGTWAVLILGFFAVGWAMRRRVHLRPGLTAE
jgi:hypothetical protein